MDVTEALEIVWDARERNERPAPEVFKQLSMAQAYAVQKGVLDRLLARDEKLVGWKIGGNSDAARNLFGADAPFSGFLLESGEFPSGSTFDLSRLPGNCVLECELCFTFAKRLAGPGVTRAQVLDALASVAPAIEIANMGRVPGLDAGQMVSDNVSQWGFVVGEAVAPYPRDLDLGAVIVTCKRNGELVNEGLSGPNIDNQLDSMAWLAGNLAEHGWAIEPGHRVMSGAALPFTNGHANETWEANFQGLGSVSATFK